ncbi:MAG: c-type cytochrome [Woeseiaceae bacterium]
MARAGFIVVLMALIGACATETPNDLIETYDGIDATTILDSPTPKPGTYSPRNQALVERGEYLTELLGCGACHTDGALVGDPDVDRSLAGSGTGIAYTNPLGEANPGVIYPANITPDNDTGIGDWTDRQIANAIRAGIGRHGGRRIVTMPWQGYARISDDDVNALVGYLRSIEPVSHRVPDEVEPGQRASHPFVYFGVYRSKR